MRTYDVMDEENSELEYDHTVFRVRIALVVFTTVLLELTERGPQSLLGDVIMTTSCDTDTSPAMVFTSITTQASCLSTAIQSHVYDCDSIHRQIMSSPSQPLPSIGRTETSLRMAEKSDTHAQSMTSLNTS